MIITYEKKRMIVRHPTGIVSEYSVADLELRKRNAEMEFEEADSAVIKINTHLINTELTE